jgi:hypothetical protein
MYMNGGTKTESITTGISANIRHEGKQRPMEAKKLCNEELEPEEPITVYCGREKGHDGPHVAAYLQGRTDDKDSYRTYVWGECDKLANEESIISSDELKKVVAEELL